MTTVTVQLLTTLLAVATLALLWLLESFRPFFKRANDRFGHARTNFLYAIVGISLTTIFSAFGLNALSRLEPYWSGVKLLGLPFWAQTLTLFLSFDAWMYVWHRLNHHVPVLWRFHRAHHGDREMDATTAFRFHPLELVFSEVVRFPVMLLLGMGAFELALYNLVLIPVILFHHSNVALPSTIDAALSHIIASPNMHRVHHSEIQAETDSNFGAVFSWWDKLFGTYQTPHAPEKITLGVKFVEPKFSKPIIK